MSWISCAHGVFGARSTAFTQTQRISGFTSQWPSGRTPPHGPLRSVFGQFIGHVMPVECSTHWPHIWQPKTGFLTAASMSASGFIASGTADRRFSIRSLASRTAVDASAA